MSSCEKLGATPLEVIGTLLKSHPQIVELSIFEPPTFPLAQERLARNSVSRELVEAGLRLRNGVGLPFWDSVLVSCFGAGKAAYEILEEAKFHNLPPKRHIFVSRNQWSPDYLASLGLEDGSMLVMSSRVRIAGGGYRHIPMLDFHCPPTAENQQAAELVAGLVHETGGYLLQSDKSYHFYGNSLLEEEDLSAYLGRALLFAPFIDRAWIAHQLIEGACGLRISTKKNGSLPSVVACVKSATKED